MLVVMGTACAVLLAGTRSHAADPLPDFFLPFPPRADAAEVAPIPLRPPENNPVTIPSRPRPPAQLRKPPFTLQDGDRVLFLGDQLLRGELEYGLLETRLTSQYPEAHVTFRNLSWLTNHPLAAPLPTPDLQTPNSWLDPLLNRASSIRPTVVILGFGTEAAKAGKSGLDAFRTDIDQLIDGLLTAPAEAPLRLVILSPLSPEIAFPSTAPVSQDEHNLLHYAQLLWEVATNRQCEFVDLYRWSQNEGQTSRASPQMEPNTAPALTQDGLRLTHYGYWRMTVALASGLRWTPNNWRFGYMADNTLRNGQFGIDLTQRSRSGHHVTAKTIEDRLPTPNPPQIPDTDSPPRPRCYLQITGLDQGVYGLYVDGELVVQGTETDWARYRIVEGGPSWTQAERLRQTIVRKNTVLLSDWLWEQPLHPPGDVGDPLVEDLETQIATLRRPVPHTYQVQRLAHGNAASKPPSAISER